MELLATAYHEAGHAFLSYVLGNGFKEVTIVPSKENLGSITNICDREFLVSIMIGESDYILPDFVINQRVKNELMILYAGYLAEKEYGVDNEVGASSDLEMITEFITHYCDDENESENLIQFCLAETTSILRDNWFQVKVLANELIEKKTMTFLEVDELFKGLKRMTFQEIQRTSESLK